MRTCNTVIDENRRSYFLEHVGLEKGFSDMISQIAYYNQAREIAISNFFCLLSVIGVFLKHGTEFVQTMLLSNGVSVTYLLIEEPTLNRKCVTGWITG